MTWDATYLADDPDAVTRLGIDVTQGLWSRLAEIPPGTDALIWTVEGIVQRRLSYGDLLNASRASARALSVDLGLSPGDRVMCLSSNCPELVICYLACLFVGAVIVPADPAAQPSDLRHLWDLTTPSLCVVNGEGTGSQHIQRAFEGSTPPLLVDLHHLALSETDVSADAVDNAPFDAPPDWPVVILSTSGTTQRSKGVCLPQSSLDANSEGLIQRHRLDRHRKLLCVLPLFHANAFGFSFWAGFRAGATMILSDGLPLMSLERVIAENEVEIISLVPSMIQLISQRPFVQARVPSLHHVVSAAAPLRSDIALSFYEKTGIRIHQGYGLSECTNFAATMPYDLDTATYDEVMHREAQPSIGPALPEMELDIVDVAGRHLGDREVGEVVIRGPSLMKGYWDNELATRETVVDGWLRTGDLGWYRQVAGRKFFFISGRVKEIIIKHGENFSPLSIEWELRALAESFPFAVAGFANHFAGEEIGLYVETAGSPAVQERIRQALEEIAPKQRPTAILISSEPIPKTATGKIQRRQVGQRFSKVSSAILSNLRPVFLDDVSVESDA